MEFLRWFLILTGIVMLVVAYMMGRKKPQKTGGYRVTPASLDPSVGDMRVPVHEPVPVDIDDLPENAEYQQEWQAESEIEHANAASYASTDADSYITGSDDAGVDMDYRDQLYQPDALQRDDYDYVDRELSEQTADASPAKVTSFASAVKAANALDEEVAGSDVDSGMDFSEEFETYHEPVQLDEFEEKLVSVHVVASNGRRFYGRELKTLFEQHGYQFGRMSLYHCALDGDKVFSIANMVKPGTFDEDQMTTFETPGITLFMRLPTELDADVAFDFLIQEAQGLAEELGGQLRDGSRNPLSEQTIQHMREDIQQYVFRTKRVLQPTT